MSGAFLWREMASILRFILVGFFNTAFGYAIILSALALGAGDYSANAIGFALGLPISYALHRGWTFRASGRASFGEGLRYALCVAASYVINLAVVMAGRQAGMRESPLVQLAAVVAYAAVFYVLSRLIVFRARG